MTKKFRASLLFAARITIVNIEKESVSSIWRMRGEHGERRLRREKKLCANDGYFNTFEEAKKFLLGIVKKNYTVAKIKLDRVKADLDKITLLDEEDIHWNQY